MDSSDSPHLIFDGPWDTTVRPRPPHIPRYTPRGERFFCLENQTCSTDAHNLFARGFVDVAGLKTVAPGATRQGAVRYAVTR